MVMAQLLGTSRRNVTVVSIKRVQNNYLRVMAKTFVDTVKQMEGPSRQDLAKPRWLWHGTKTCTALDSIVHSGFNPLVSGRSTVASYMEKAPTLPGLLNIPTTMHARTATVTTL